MCIRTLPARGSPRDRGRPPPSLHSIAWRSWAVCSLSLSWHRHAVLCVAFAFEAVLTREFCQTRPPWNAGPSLANTDRTRKLDHAPTQGRYASHVWAGRSATHTTDLALRASSVPA
ncbi:hypothetical protein PO909_023467 [Leuciscus waleckii]